MMYKDFANVYDRFMSGTPYSRWAAYIDGILRKQKAKTVLDLACGTGNITISLAKKGYEMIAADISADMLSEARMKADGQGLDILFLMQDIRGLDLYDTVDAAVCVCDALNYLTDEKDLAKAFKRTALFLNPGGVFIFDMNTEYKYKEILGDKTFTETADGASYIWKNYYDAATGINEYDIFFIVKNPPRKFSEKHFQKSYPPEKVRGLLESAGLTLTRINDAYTDNPPSPESERISFTAEKLCFPDAAR